MTRQQDIIARATRVVAREADHLPVDYLADVFSQQVEDLSALKRARRRVLLVGGCGYVGLAIADQLLQDGYEVVCLDNAIYGHGDAAAAYFNNPAFTYVDGDIRKSGALAYALDGVSDVVLLAGLVGDPITKKYPKEAEEINLDGLRSCLEHLQSRQGICRVIFISTCSNYGLVKSGEPSTEESELMPLSLYAKAKVAIEREALALKGRASFPVTILRFATAFGISPRMRFDLTVNEFSRDLALGRKLVVFDPDTWRPYCHVGDFALLIRRVLEAPRDRIDFQVFNAGGDVNNSTKRSLLETIQRHVPDTDVEIQLEGPDPRNYRVDFTKVRTTLHFEPRWSIEDGVTQIVSAVRAGLFRNDDSLYGNYRLRDAGSMP